MCGHSSRAVIFDLDGTLVQTRLASWQAFQPVSERFGLGVDSAEQFYELFQDNFYRGLRDLCGNESRAAEVEEAFLAALRTDYAPPMIPGMADVVKALAPHATLTVLSSNATAVIRRILLDNQVAYCFAHVFGGDVEPDKRLGIQRFLADAALGAGRRCEASYDEGECRCGTVDSVLVTDTVGDILAARACGIRAVGVAWGMHSEPELRKAGAEFVAIWPQELLAGLFAEPNQDAAVTGCSLALPGHGAELTESVRIRRDRRLRHGERPIARWTPKEQRTDESASGRTDIDEQLLAAMRRILH